MNEELDLIIQQMVESGESDESIQGVIEHYNKSNSTPDVEEQPAPLKKKEATVLQFPSEEVTSVSDGSDIEPSIDSPVLPPSIETMPDQIVNEPIADLYEQYKGAGKIKPAQQQIIESKLEAQKKGDRGFWETAIAVTEGYFKTGVATPMFQYDNKEDLLAKRQLKNKVDFLSELPEETLVELKSYAGEKITELEDSNLNVLAENKMMEERSKKLSNEMKYQVQGITRLQETGQDIPEDVVEAYQKNYLELQAISSTYNNNIDSIENNNEDIGDFYEEVNLLKKNYGGLDYYKDMARLTSASMMAGAAEMGLTTQEMVTKHTGMKLFADAPFDQEDITEFRAEIADQQELQKPNMSVSDIESMGDFGGWLGEQIATQLPVLTVLAASGGTAGLGLLGVSAAGQKIGELEVKREEANETIKSMNDLLESGQEFTEEELKDIDGAIAEATKVTEISQDEMYLAGLGSFALEVLTEKVTLGILSKGKRAYTAAKNSGGASWKEFGKGIGRSFTGGLEEGGAEFVNQVGGNLIDILYLNDPDVHIFDGAIDALASGGAMGWGMKFAPMALGMGAKAFVPKEVTAKMKSDINKISELNNELESNENLDNETKKVIKSKIEKLKEDVAKGMKKTFGDVSKMPKESIAELVELDKKANSIAKRVQELQKSNINKELKAEFIADLKRDIDAIAKRKQEILDEKGGIKPETQETVKKEFPDRETFAGTFEGAAKDGETDGTVQEETGEDTDNVENVRPRVKLKKQSKGIYTDTINDYTVNKTEEGSWEVRTEEDSKGKRGNTVLGSFKTLKEATAYLQEQTDKRSELLAQSQKEANSGNLFENNEGKSKFNWRKMLSGVPVLTYIDEITFSKAAKAIEDKLAYYGNKAFLGQFTIQPDGTVGRTRTQRNAIALKNFGIELVNSTVVGVANASNSLYKGSLRTDSEIASSRKVEGYQKRTLMDAKVLTKNLGDMINNDPDSAKRVHQALDPDIYDETVKYEDLNEGEKALFDTLRSINQATHELNYKNGFISKETFDKYDGKYIGRGYEVHEDGLTETEREVMVNTRFFGNIYKQRQEINQWIMDNTLNDPIYLTMNRMVRSQRNVIVKDYADFIATKYGVKEKPDRGVFTQLTGKSYGKLDGMWIPSNVAEDFKGYFFNNSFLDGAYQALNIYNQSLYKQFMKRFHTVYSPLVQVGNFVSNLAFATAAGVNIMQLGMNIGPAFKDLKNKTGDFEAVMQEGIIGSNVLEKDLQLSKEAKNQLSSGGQSKILQLDAFARRAYSASDNAMKLAAYKSLKQAGYNHEESVQRVYEGFQNYASVGKIWDIFSKFPVWGSDYIKFQGDLNRIVKNAVTKRPLTTATFLYGLNLIAMVASKLSGEEEEERAIREGRTFIPKIQTFLGDSPLIFRVGDSEVNLARYISPYYKYDIGAEHWTEAVASYSPVNLSYNEETDSMRIVPSDVALGSIWAAFVDNKDFRNKIITDPDYSIYTGSTASTSQKLTNRVMYVLRSQVPLFSFGNDLVLSQAFGEDYYGRTTDPAKVLLSRIVKIQTWDDSTTAKQVVKNLKGISYEVKGLKTQRSSISNNYDKEVRELNKKLEAGEINEAKFNNSVESASDGFEKRSAALAEKEAKVQQEFNELQENVKSLGVDFKTILSKAKD